MEFFEAAADWGERQGVVVTFERDEKDGWFARLCFSDSRGPYSRIADQLTRGPIIDEETGKSRQETHEEFVARVERMMGLACVNAHKSRLPKLRMVHSDRMGNT